MKHNIHVITAVSRPQNLPILQRHLATRLASHSVHWTCSLDYNHVAELPTGVQANTTGSGVPDRAGGAQKNAALNKIGLCTTEWVYFLDDDNTVHPDFDAALSVALKTKADAHIFGQYGRSGRVLRLADAKNVRSGRINLGQFLIRRDVIGGTRFPIDVYDSDWQFFQAINPQRIRDWPPATYYNALQNSPPTYTADWFTHNLPLFLEHILPLADRPTEILEIGSYEGRSTRWILDNLPQARLTCLDPFDCPGREETFLRNTLAHSDRVTLHAKPSRRVLHTLTGPFDAAYVDGSHRSIDVLYDLAHTLPLLKPGGLLIADDYAWQGGGGPTERPKLGIDAFLANFGDAIRILHHDYSLVAHVLSDPH